MTPERRIQNECCAALRALGAFIFVHDSVGVFDPRRGVFRRNNNPYRIRGVADILGIFRGVPLAVEIKTKTGRLTDHQKDFLEQWREAGGIAIVARCVADLHPELERQLLAIKMGEPLQKK